MGWSTSISRGKGSTGELTALFGGRKGVSWILRIRSSEGWEGTESGARSGFRAGGLVLWRSGVF